MSAYCLRNNSVLQWSIDGAVATSGRWLVPVSCQTESNGRVGDSQSLCEAVDTYAFFDVRLVEKGGVFLCFLSVAWGSRPHLLCFGLEFLESRQRFSTWLNEHALYFHGLVGGKRYRLLVCATPSLRGYLSHSLAAQPKRVSDACVSPTYSA